MSEKLDKVIGLLIAHDCFSSEGINGLLDGMCQSDIRHIMDHCIKLERQFCDAACRQYSNSVSSKLSDDWGDI